MVKKWYHSKTLIANVLMGVAVLVQAVTGQDWLDVEVQGAIIIIVNLILRLITKQGLSK